MINNWNHYYGLCKGRICYICCGVGGPYPAAARVWSPGYVYDRKNDTIIDNERL